MLAVIPVCHKDVHLMEMNLDLCHKLGQSGAGHECLVSFERGTNVKAIQDKASRVFGKVHSYEYEPYNGKPEWPRPQNYAWQAAARYIPERFPTHWLWWEPDVTPLRGDWLNRLDSAYRDCGKPIMGNVVSGMGHLNGVAIYPRQVAEYAPDSLLVRSSPFDLHLSKEAKGRIHAANHLMAHHPRVHGVILRFEDNGALKMLLDGQFCCFHGCADESLARLLMAA